MDHQEIKEMLIEYYEDLLSGEMGEAVLPIIEDTLKTYPEYLQIFIDKFKTEKDRSDKETLAQIILSQEHYQPAIDFLSNEMGWDDFSGYVGFPESWYTNGKKT